MWIPIKDDSETDLYSVIPITNLFISLAIQNGKVLVHWYRCVEWTDTQQEGTIAFPSCYHRFSHSSVSLQLPGVRRRFSSREDHDLSEYKSLSWVHATVDFISQLLCYAESKGNEFEAEETFRLEHFNQVLRQFNEGFVPAWDP